jgi:hypothetical protein
MRGCAGGCLEETAAGISGFEFRGHSRCVVLFIVSRFALSNVKFKERKGGDYTDRNFIVTDLSSQRL